MHDIIHKWASDYFVHPHAIADLLQRLGVGFEMINDQSIPQGASETAVSQRVRLLAADHKILTWRNNVGAMQDNSERVVRYGLCNDTAALNKKIKSADLIGIKPIMVTQAMVGLTVGQFWSREVKAADWKYTGTEREVAQAKWAALVISRGGDAAFTTGSI